METEEHWKQTNGVWGVGDRVEELMLMKWLILVCSGALMGGQGWRKLWLCGGPLCAWGDWLIGLSALNAGNQVVDFFLDHPSHCGPRSRLLD